MKTVLLSIVALAIPLQGATAQDPCDSAQTTARLDECFSRQLRLQTAALKQLEDSLAARLDSASASKLRTASTAWLVYRDAQCEAVATRNEGGTLAPVALLGCKRRLIEERMTFLRDAYSP
jgi:uncharacterized protein YecT (DUF1311 family)